MYVSNFSPPAAGAKVRFPQDSRQAGDSVSIRRNTVTFFALLILSITALSTAAQAMPAKKGRVSQEIPLTTNSAEARDLFQQGRAYRENWRLPEALQVWRSAALKDPNFALAHLYV